jgi:integrase/recombinase XerD
VERYQRHLFYARKKDGQPLSATSQHHALTALRQYFKWCARQRLIPANPASEVQLPKLGRRLPRHCLTVAEVEKVLQQPRVSTVTGVRDRAVMELLWAAALRRSEVLRLKLHDVRVGEGTVFVQQGKGKKDRVVPMSARAGGWVQRYVEEARRQLWVPPETGILFLSDTGHPLSPDVLTQKVRQYLDEAGIKAAGSCHLFRHASATALLEGGADIRFVQEFLGHSKLEATEVYTHVTLTKLKAVYEACHPGARVPAVTPGVETAPSSSEEVLAALEEEGEEEDELRE